MYKQVLVAVKHSLQHVSKTEITIVTVFPPCPSIPSDILRRHFCFEMNICRLQTMNDKAFDFTEQLVFRKLTGSRLKVLKYEKSLINNKVAGTQESFVSLVSRSHSRETAFEVRYFCSLFWSWNCHKAAVVADFILAFLKRFQVHLRDWGNILILWTLWYLLERDRSI